ncbi:zinc finger C2H2 type [Echinococcus multilocularis]|uniref:Zinc finger C2H2 type n=1 Tax=Echinococcus multilocularis TaxID=6211 RepID=A0A068YG93_ECHMU|nr:zinc finger C2H2 type [Echinococcus multilocularis]
MPLVCPICFRHFRYHRQLQVHFNAMHTELGRFTCVPCKTTYRFFPCLQGHMSHFHNEFCFSLGMLTHSNEISTLEDHFFCLFMETRQREFQAASFLPQSFPDSILMNFDQYDVPKCDYCGGPNCERLFYLRIRGSDSVVELVSALSTLEQPAVNYLPFIS